jgi:hypothetical protein
MTLPPSSGGEVLILGGYGNFGKRIARALVRDGVRVILAGRNEEKAAALASTLPEGFARTARIDITQDITPALSALRPAVVVHSCGPFQARDYGVAQSCIATGTAYIDLSDGREFVNGITALDEAAKAKGVAVISGASSVPGLSSAVVEHFLPQFAQLERMIYGISPGQQAERGLATTQAILGYTGKPLKLWAGLQNAAYGWQDIYLQPYPGLGKRWMANCDVPDLDLFPTRYGLRDIRFSAGLELGALHLSLWLLSWLERGLARAGITLNLPRFAAPLLAASNIFNRFGSADGGMHVRLKGWDSTGSRKEINWFVLARNGDGPQIPCVPAIILARKLATGHSLPAGAIPCLGLVSLPEYLAELQGYAIETVVTP